MKAKLIINEIKQDKESGLSAVGIGKIEMTKTYYYIKDNFNSIIVESDELYYMDNIPQKVKEKIITMVNVDNEEDVMGISDSKLLSMNDQDTVSDFVNWIIKITNYPIKEENVIIEQKLYRIQNYYNKIHLTRLRTYDITDSSTGYKFEQSYTFFAI